MNTDQKITDIVMTMNKNKLLRKSVFRLVNPYKVHLAKKVLVHES